MTKLQQLVLGNKFQAQIVWDNIFRDKIVFGHKNCLYLIFFWSTFYFKWFWIQYSIEIHIFDQIFLYSANTVSTGPTCQKVCACLYSVFPAFFSRLLIGWSTLFWQWFWHTAYSGLCSQQCRSLDEQCHTQIFKLGWAVPHSKSNLRCFKSDFDAVKSIFDLLIEIEKTTSK